MLKLCLVSFFFFFFFFFYLTKIVLVTTVQLSCEMDRYLFKDCQKEHKYVCLNTTLEKSRFQSRPSSYAGILPFSKTAVSLNLILCHSFSSYYYSRSKYAMDFLHISYFILKLYMFMAILYEYLP